MKSQRYRLCVSVISTVPLLASLAPCAADDWPQWRGPNRDGVWTEKGVIERFSGPPLKLRWRARISNGYSGPTVADGRVYVTDRVTDPKQMERVHCFDAMTGQNIWTHSYDCVYRRFKFTDGPRASVTIDGDRAYSLGSMGHLLCLHASEKKLLWRRDLDADYSIRMPVWGIAPSPLVEEDLVIVQIGGSGGACIVAFDKMTGKERWRALKDRASYSSPIMIEQAGRRVLVCLTGERVAGLDPRSGKLYWDHAFPPTRMVIGVPTPIPHKDYLFVCSFYDGSLLLKLDQTTLAVQRVWQRRGASEKQTDALHCMISTPVIIGDHIYGVDSYGELRCLDLLTGNRAWESLKATPRARWSNIHFVRNGDKVWMFNEKGDLIISMLSPEGFHEISRAKLITPTAGQLRKRRPVCWTHPAFANRHVYVRNDNELVCADLSAK